MAATTDLEPNTPERLIALTIGASYGLWFVGGLYFAGPLLAWTLAFMVARKGYLAPALALEERLTPPSGVIWAWLISMAAMLLILLVGHADFELGAAQTVKSAVGWAKGWALLALFPLAGYCLPIRLSVLARAVCLLGRQTLLLLPLFLLAPLVHLPQILFISPLKVLGGASDEFFAIVLFTLEPGIGTPRWQFFAPWSPAAGMIAVIYFLLAREEAALRWRWTGYSASMLMAILSQSRLAIVALVVIIPLVTLVGSLGRPRTWLILAPIVLIAGAVSPQLQELAAKATTSFDGARADSTRVRGALGRIAVERWRHEAYWFGHGVVERGPHLVEHMPIGSHHSWYGLLYVKGLSGAVALAVPMLWTLAVCLVAATRNRAGRLGLAMILIYWLYSFGENLEVVTFLSWPALLAIGITMRMQRTTDAGATQSPQSS